MPMPDAPRDGCARLWPIDRAIGPRRPTSARGIDGVGMVLVTPMSRRAKATRPIASMTTHEDDQQDDGRPVELAGQRQVVRGPAAPGQVGERRQLRARAPIAVEDEAGDGDEAGDARRRATADERAERERDRAGGERHEHHPDRSSRTPGSTLISSPGRTGEGGAGDGDRDERDEEDDAQAVRMWPESFSSAMRRRDLPVAATNSRLPRCASPARVPGQGQDRPQAQQEREERAVLVLEVAAQRARR